MYINLDLNNLIVFLVIGLVAGFAASFVTGRRKTTWFSNLLLGIGGAFLGGILLPAVGIRFWGFTGTLLAAFIGSLILIWVSNLFSNRPSMR